jgi:hypothetical protein
VSGFERVIVDIPTDLMLGTSAIVSTRKILREYDNVTQSIPLLSNVRRVGPLFSSIGYSRILFDSISRFAILSPVISANHILLLSGDKTIPIGPDCGVGILISSIFPLVTSNLPIEFVLASVNHIKFLPLSKTS